MTDPVDRFMFNWAPGEMGDMVWKEMLRDLKALLVATALAQRAECADSCKGIPGVNADSYEDERYALAVRETPLVTEEEK